MPPRLTGPQPPMRLLLINPNTSVHITERMAASARTVLRPQDRLTAVTAETGPVAVRSPSQLAAADANALALAERHAPGHDALLLAISLDGAAPTLRQRHPGLPVQGMTEAALHAAAALTRRIGLLTLGAELLPLYRQRAEQLGLAEQVVAWQAPEAPAAFDPAASADVDAVLDAAVQRLQQGGAQVVVLAGAVLCGHAPRLQQAHGLPVIDGVRAAVQRLHALRSRPG